MANNKYIKINEWVDDLVKDRWFYDAGLGCSHLHKTEETAIKCAKQICSKYIYHHHYKFSRMRLKHGQKVTNRFYRDDIVDAK